jgi:CheY-like chemotaxis protein
MGGSMGVSSTVGQGSTFWVELRVAEPAAEPVDEPVDVTASDPSAPAQCVLHVDDMIENLRLVEKILRQRPGVTLLPAMLGGVAVDLAREHRPDLVLLDLHLPDMSGEEVLRRLRADPATAGIPVVVLSADGSGRKADRLLALGATGYLTKPLSAQDVLGVVDQAFAVGAG